MGTFHFLLLKLILLFSLSLSLNAILLHTKDYGDLDYSQDINFLDSNDVATLSKDYISKTINGKEYIFLEVRDVKKGYLYLSNKNQNLQTKMLKAIPIKYIDRNNLNQISELKTVYSQRKSIKFTNSDMNEIYLDTILLFQSFNSTRWLIVFEKLSSFDDNHKEDLFAENYPLSSEKVDKSFWKRLYYRKIIEEDIRGQGAMVKAYIDASGKALINSIDATDNITHKFNIFGQIYANGIVDGFVLNGSERLLDLFENYMHASAIEENLSAKAIEAYVGSIFTIVTKPDLYSTTVSLANSFTKIVTSSVTIGLTEHYSRKLNNLLVARQISYLRFYRNLSIDEVFNLYKLNADKNTWYDLANKVAESLNLYDYNGLCANPLISSDITCIVYKYQWANDIEPEVVINLYNAYRDGYDIFETNFKNIINVLPKDIDGDGIVNINDSHPNDKNTPAKINISFNLNKTTTTMGNTIIATSTSSDINGDTLSYRWSLSKPKASHTKLSSFYETKVSFVPDIIGSYSITLVVSDGKSSKSLTKSIDILPKSVKGHNIALNTLEVSPYIKPDKKYCVDITAQNKGKYDEAIYAKLYVNGSGINFESKEIKLGFLKQGYSNTYNNSACYTFPSNLTNGYYSFKAKVYSKNGDEDWSDNINTSISRYGSLSKVFSTSYKSKFLSLKYNSNLDISGWANNGKGGWGWYKVSTPKGIYDIAFYGNSKKNYFFIKKNGSLIVKDKKVYMGDVYAFDNGNLLVGVDFYNNDYAGIQAMWPTKDNISITPEEAEIEIGKTAIFKVDLGVEGGVSSMHYHEYKTKFNIRFNLDDTSLENDLIISNSRKDYGHELKVTPKKVGTYNIVVNLDDISGNKDYYIVLKIIVIAPPIDSDNDGIIDLKDAFPNDKAASIDSDGDGYPDSWNSGYSEADSTTELKLDKYPNDKNKWKDETNSDSKLSNGLVAYYKFENNFDDSIRSTGTGNEKVSKAIFINSPDNKGIKFTGVNNYRIEIEKWQPKNSSFTVSSLFKIDSMEDFSIAHQAPIITEQTGDFSDGFVLRIQKEKEFTNNNQAYVSFFINDGFSRSQSLTYELPLHLFKQWNLLSVTVDRDNSKIILYLNGNEIVKKDLKVGNILPSYAFIGAYDYKTARNGYPRYVSSSIAIDDLRIYNRALKSDEIKKLYEIGQQTISAKSALIVNNKNNLDIVSSEFKKLMPNITIIGADEISAGSVDLANYGTLACFIYGGNNAVSNFSSNVLQKIKTHISSGTTFISNSEVCGGKIYDYLKLQKYGAHSGWYPALKDSNFIVDYNDNILFKNVVKYNADPKAYDASHWTSGDYKNLLFRIDNSRSYTGKYGAIGKYLKEPDNYLAKGFGTGWNVGNISDKYYPQWNIGNGKVIKANGLNWTFDQKSKKGGYIGIAGREILKNIANGLSSTTLQTINTSFTYTINNLIVGKTYVIEIIDNNGKVIASNNFLARDNTKISLLYFSVLQNQKYKVLISQTITLNGKKIKTWESKLFSITDIDSSETFDTTLDEAIKSSLFPKEIFDGALLVEKVSTNSDINITALLNITKLGAVKDKYFVYWDETSVIYKHGGNCDSDDMPDDPYPSLTMRYAINSYGDIYLGLYSNTNPGDTLSMLVTGGGNAYQSTNDRNKIWSSYWLEFSTASNQMATFIANHYKDTLLKNNIITKGYMTLDEFWTKSKFSLLNNFNKPIFVLFSYIQHQHADYSWYSKKYEIWDQMLREHWSPAITKDTNMMLSRNLSLSYKNPLYGYIETIASNDNRNYGELWLDGKSTGLQRDCGSIYRFFEDTYPKDVKMNSYGIWSSHGVRFRMAIVGDGIYVKKFNESYNNIDNPKKSYDKNPKPIILKLNRGWNSGNVTCKNNSCTFAVNNMEPSIIYYLLN